MSGIFRVVVVLAAVPCGSVRQQTPDMLPKERNFLFFFEGYDRAYWDPIQLLKWIANLSSFFADSRGNPCATDY